MLENDEIERVLNEFIDYVVSKSNQNAPRASGDLARSIKGNVKVNPNSIEATIEGEDYLEFIDKGVHGTRSSYIETRNSPFRYRNKKPPVRFLQTWLKQKSGKFLARNRRSAAFALQNHIFQHGIRATKFFTNPFEEAFKQLPENLTEAFGLDLESFMEFALNKNRK